MDSDKLVEGAVTHFESQSKQFRDYLITLAIDLVHRPSEASKITHGVRPDVRPRRAVIMLQINTLGRSERVVSVEVLSVIEKLPDSMDGIADSEERASSLWLKALTLNLTS